MRRKYHLSFSLLSITPKANSEASLWFYFVEVWSHCSHSHRWCTIRMIISLLLICYRVNIHIDANVVLANIVQVFTVCIVYNYRCVFALMCTMYTHGCRYCHWWFCHYYCAVFFAPLFFFHTHTRTNATLSQSVKLNYIYIVRPSTGVK